MPCVRNGAEYSGDWTCRKEFTIYLRELGKLHGFHRKGVGVRVDKRGDDSVILEGEILFD